MRNWEIVQYFSNMGNYEFGSNSSSIIQLQGSILDISLVHVYQPFEM